MVSLPARFRRFWRAAALLPAVAIGCTQKSSPAPRAVPAAATFSRDVAPILRERCQGCHRPGGIAPFSLLTFQDALDHRRQIVKMTSSRRMPPWSVGPGCAEYQDDPSLSQREIETIGRWAAAGAPQGDPRRLPPPRTFSEWELGEPDLKVRIAKPYTPDFSKGDDYRCFVFPTRVPQDRWVSAVAIVPGNAKMVHHALVWVEKGSSSEKLIRKNPARGFPCFGSSVVPTDSIGEWVPGNRPHFFPAGTGRRFPKGSRVILQIHYSAHYAMGSGGVQPDETTVGIYFAKQPIEKPIHADWVYGPIQFVIPAGARSHTLEGSLTLPAPTRLLAIWPHMHLLGKTMKATATLPDGRKICLVDVTRWDFHWQRTYWFKEPIDLPAGTRVDMVSTYDNSTDNPYQPSDPPRDVTRGMGTTDEMSQVALYYTVEGEPREKPARPPAEVAAAPAGPRPSGSRP
jgi:mono/diheme cytochrome c family protein